MYVCMTLSFAPKRLSDRVFCCVLENGESIVPVESDLNSVNAPLNMKISIDVTSA